MVFLQIDCYLACNQFFAIIVIVSVFVYWHSVINCGLIIRTLQHHIVYNWFMQQLCMLYGIT